MVDIGFTSKSSIIMYVATPLTYPQPWPEVSIVVAAAGGATKLAGLDMGQWHCGQMALGSSDTY